MASALAACAANKQGKFVQMDQLLWKAFRDRAVDTERCWEGPGGCKIVDGFARQLGLSMTRYKADVRACQTTIADEMRELSTLGVSVTPAFFINGRYMAGARPVDSFAMLIDEELAKAEARIQAGTPKASYYQKWVLDAGLTRLEPPSPASGP
jgi:predicted DsbA family dithiol-disulfide isomerase